MDVFYEESAVNVHAEKGQKTYKIMHYLSIAFLMLGIFTTFLTIMFIPIKTEDNAENYASLLSVCLLLAAFALTFIIGYVILLFLKRKVNINFDYVFVSGELRISKVFNVNRRKLVDRISCEDILQIGDTDNATYDRLRTDPNTTEVVLTPNVEPSEGKFFMYILVHGSIKTLYVLECRETLLMHILKFARRSALESDYVMQEKKQRA